MDNNIDENEMKGMEMDNSLHSSSPHDLQTDEKENIGKYGINPQSDSSGSEMEMNDVENEKTQLDSEPDEQNQSNKENFKESIKKKKCASNSRQRKKTKNQIKDERLKIHSETHRMMREREISVPYHVPKQRTLKEFLARKKNRDNIPLKAPSSKMIEIWKDIEESTKNAFEFFKSDSDSDDEKSGNEENGDVAESESKDKTIDCTNPSEKAETMNNNFDKGFSGEENSVIPGDVCHTLEERNAESSQSTNANKNVFTIENTPAESDTNIDVLVNNEGENGEVDGRLAGKKPSTISKWKNDYSTPCGEENCASVNSKAASLGDENPESAIEPARDDEEFIRQRTSDWIKDIPSYEKLLKRSKKETLLQKLNPKLLNITPKLSGEPDSVINLENDKRSMEIGAKRLMQRFFDTCAALKQKKDKEVRLRVSSCVRGRNGEINDVITENLIYSPSETLDDPDLVRPGAKLQRLREQLKKKIEEKWEEEHKRKTVQLQTAKSRKSKSKSLEENDVVSESDDEFEEMDRFRGIYGSEDDEDADEEDEEEEEEGDVRGKDDNLKAKNQFINSEAEESGCEDEDTGSEGNEAGNEDDESGIEENESEDERRQHPRSDDIKMKDCSVQLEKFNAPDDPQRFSLKLDAGVYSEMGYDGSQCSLVPAYQPGGGLLRGGSDLTQTDKDDSLPGNVLSPALGLSLELSPLSKNESSSRQTWDLNVDAEMGEEQSSRANFVPRFPESGSFDLSDAYEFCSGKFPGEADAIRPGGDNSQDLLTAAVGPSRVSTGSCADGFSVDDSGCGERGDEKSGRKDKARSRLRVLSDSSDEENDLKLDGLKEIEDITSDRFTTQEDSNDSEQIFNVKNRKFSRLLHFSDDEDDDHNSEAGGEDKESSSSESSEENNLDDDRFKSIEYDSEENEIVHPAEFFEKEAELSGSEYSGDEDEKDLDELDVEDGDADKLDEHKVRSQLERIHMRRVLDDDSREIRLLKEIFFEDGDLYDGKERQKNFRWKNLGTFFDDNDEENKNGADEDNQDDFDNEQSAKARHEKELFLLQLKNKREVMDSEDDKEGKSLLRLGKVVLEKSVKAAVRPDGNAPKGPGNAERLQNKIPFALSNKRGSFLSRNEEFLSRLAKYTSNSSDNILGPKHSKNFVFSAQSPEKNNISNEDGVNSKRKNRSPKKEMSKNKRSKLDAGSVARTSSLLDRLT